MSSQFTKDLAQFKGRACPTCAGLGECDDASPYDIQFSTWTCKTCGGTGYKPQEGMTEAENLARLSAQTQDMTLPVEYRRNAAKCAGEIALDLYRSGRLVLLPSVEELARAINPEAWAEDLPVPTRARVLAYHAARQKAVNQATAIHNHMKGTGDVASMRWDDETAADLAHLPENPHD